jgi:hypothetical protein
MTERQHNARDPIHPARESQRLVRYNHVAIDATDTKHICLITIAETAITNVPA